MRTTIRLNDHLLHKAQEVAHTQGTTFTALVEEALHRLLHEKSRPSKTAKGVRLITFKGDGLLAGIDLDDTSSLLEQMEQSR